MLLILTVILDVIHAMCEPPVGWIYLCGVLLEKKL